GSYCFVAANRTRTCSTIQQLSESQSCSLSSLHIAVRKPARSATGTIAPPMSLFEARPIPTLARSTVLQVKQGQHGKSMCVQDEGGIAEAKLPSVRLFDHPDRLVHLRPVSVSLIDIPGNVLLPSSPHVSIVVQIQLVADDRECGRVGRRLIPLGHAEGAKATVLGRVLVGMSEKGFAVGDG